MISSYTLGTTDFLKAHFLVHKSLEDITKSETEGTKYTETERWDRESKEEEGLEKATMDCFIAEKIRIRRKQQGTR